MTATAVAFNELEWRSYSVMAQATHSIIAAKRDSLFADAKRLAALRSTCAQMEDLLEFLHAPDIITSVEAASDVELTPIVEKMRCVPQKVDNLLASLRPIETWGMRAIAEAQGHRLRSLNVEFSSHIRALSDRHRYMMLSKSDQDRLVSAIVNPAPPNEALRRALASN